MPPEPLLEATELPLFDAMLQNVDALGLNTKVP